MPIDLIIIIVIHNLTYENINGTMNIELNTLFSSRTLRVSLNVQFQDNEIIYTTSEHCPFEALKNGDDLDNTVSIKGRNRETDQTVRPSRHLT